MLQALIFDIDGTVADTEKFHLLAFNHAFGELNLGFDWSIQEYRKLLEICGGKERVCHYLKTYCPKGAQGRDCRELVAEIHKIKTREYLRFLSDGKIEFRAGVKELMEEAIKSGIHLAIATTTSFVNIDGLFKPVFGRNWQRLFRIVGDGDTIESKKPDSAVYEYVLKNLRLKPSEVLAFEDSQNGLIAALGSKIATIITRNDFTFFQDFDGAALVCDGLDKIPKYRRFLPREIRTPTLNLKMAQAILSHANTQKGM